MLVGRLECFEVAWTTRRVWNLSLVRTEEPDHMLIRMQREIFKVAFRG